MVRPTGTHVRTRRMLSVSRAVTLFQWARGGRCGAPVVTADGRPIKYGAGGYGVHYQLMCRNALGLRASEDLLDAMFDGARWPLCF